MQQRAVAGDDAGRGLQAEYDGVQYDDEEDDQLRGRVQDDRADFLPPCGRGRLSHDACQVGGGCICGQAVRTVYARIRKKPNGQAFYGARIVSIFSDGLHGLGPSEKIMVDGFSFRQTVRAATPIFAGF